MSDRENHIVPDETSCRPAILWSASFGRARQGSELLSKHICGAFPDARVITFEDLPDDFIRRLDFRWFRLADLLRALAVGRYFNRIQKKEKYDFVVAQGVMGLYFTFCKPKVPCVHVLNFIIKSFSDSPAITSRKDRIIGAFWGWLERISGWRKDVRLTICEDTERDIKKYYDLDYDVIIPLAVNTDVFRSGDKKSERQALNLPADKPLGLFVGRAEYAKGYDILLKTAQNFPEIGFVVISPRQLEGAYPGNIIVRHGLSHSELAHYYRAADFLFHPSRFESGICYALLEAMASNLPIIACRCAIHNLPSEFNEMDIGLIISDYNEGGFANAVKTFISRPVQVKSREIVEKHYSLNSFERRWRDLSVQLSRR